MKHRFPAFLTSVLLAAAAWAQEGGEAVEATPASIAAKTMQAMEALEVPAADHASPTALKPKETKAASGVKTSKSNKISPDPKSELEEEETASPTLLPTTGAEGARGMDLMSRARMDMMIPTGRSHKGVHYPMYRPTEMDRAAPDSGVGATTGITAALASLFESEVVTRLDDDHVQFERAKWVQFEEQPAADGQLKPTMSLEIERGVYDLKNEILMTNQPVKIENPQFLITGDTMLHDRVSGLTRLTGRVHMTFYNEVSDAAAAAAMPSPAVLTPQPHRQP